MFQTFASGVAILKGKGAKAPLLLIFMIAALTVMAPASNAQEAVESRQLGDLVAPNAESTPSAEDGAVVDLTGDPDATLPSSVQELGEPLSQQSDNLIELIDNQKPLRIGLMAERGRAYLQTRVAPFRDYLQAKLSRPVEIIAFENMKALMAAHTSKQIDYATYPAGVFAMAQAACGCLLPLVAPVSQQAPEGVYILMVVRSDSNIKSLADMTGRSLALSSRSGALPYHMALNELQRSGLNANRDLSVVFSRDTPQEALSLLDKGEVDAALVWSSTQYSQQLSSSSGAVAAYLENKAPNDGVGNAGFISIWSSPAIPAGPHVVHSDMPKQERADLINALTAMNKDAPEAYDAIERYYDGGFRRVSLEDYEPIVQVATAK